MRDSHRPAAALPGPARTAAPVPGSARKRVRWLLIVIAIMVVLTAGWPLINLAVSDNRRLAPNTSLVVGPSQPDSARVTVGPGWSMLAAQSNPHLGYELQRGTVEVSIVYIRLLDHAQAAALWSGMRQLVRIDHPGALLSTPRSITSRHGAQGDAGLVTGQNLKGTATVYTDPGRNFAIEMLVVAPDHYVLANLVAAQRIIASLIFLSAAR